MNETLNNIKQEIEAQIPKQLAEVFERAVLAGNKIIHDPKTHQMAMKQLQKEGDPADNVGEGIAKVVGLLYATSNKKAPIRVLVMAGVVLLCDAIDFVEQSGMVTVDDTFIAEATKSFISSFMQLMKVDPDQVPAMLEQARAAQERAGVESAPEAAPQAAPAPAPAQQGIIGQQVGA